MARPLFMYPKKPCTSCGKVRAIIRHPVRWILRREVPMFTTGVPDAFLVGSVFDDHLITRVESCGTPGCFTVYGRKQS